MTEEREPFESLMARTQAVAEEVVCVRCGRIGGALIDRHCGRCLGVSR